MLVITTTMRMVDGVHSNTTSARPVVTLSLVFVERPTSLQQRLLDPSTTSNDSNGNPAASRNGLFRSRRETDTGFVVLRVSDDGSIGSGCSGERTTVTDLLFDVADDGTFGTLGDGENVSDGEGRFFAAVHESTSVETLGCDECLFAEFVAVWVTENDSGEGCTTARVVDDFFYDSTDVAVSFSVVERSELGRVLVEMCVRLENGMRAPLCPNNSTHGLIL